MTSDNSLLWRKNPTDIEANLVIVGLTLGAFLGLSYAFYRAIDWDTVDSEWRGKFPPGRYAEDLRDVTNEPYSMAVLAMPGAQKATDDFYSVLLSKNDIRLLVLHPGRFDDEIHVHMDHITLGTDHPRYEALSYTWGDEQKTEMVHSYDKDTLVTPNLYSALRRLRLEDRDRILWVDALCIDQSDVEERSSQVRLMGEVFSEAHRVIVWLGEERPATAKAFSSLGALDNFYWDYEVQKSSSTTINSILVKGYWNESVDWPSINDFLRRPWFHRLWVIQEISHAQRAIIVCGKVTIPWHTLAGACLYMEKFELALFLNQPALYAYKIVSMIEGLRAEKNRRPLFDVILSNTYGGCSDPRDKIFAVMSISQENDWQRNLDYSLPMNELFKRFAIWDIIRNGSLRVLACASTGPYDSEIPPRLPSWVPDWSRLMDPHLLVLCRSKSKFAASRNMQRDVRFSHNKEIMHAKGAIVDSIDTLGSAPALLNACVQLEMRVPLQDQLALTHQWLRECWEIAAAGRPMTRSTYEALWKTMLCGLTSNGDPVPENYSKYYQQYIAFIREALEILKSGVNVDYSKASAQGHQVLQDMMAEALLIIRVAQGGVDTQGEPRSSSSEAWCELLSKDIRKNSPIEDALRKWSSRKRFCRTEESRLARVPENAAPGDSICILHGSEVPYVLRLQEDGTFKVIGECYVHGLMHGDALDLPSYKPRILTLR